MSKEDAEITETLNRIVRGKITFDKENERDVRDFHRVQEEYGFLLQRPNWRGAKKEIAKITDQVLAWKAINYLVETFVIKGNAASSWRREWRNHNDQDFIQNKKKTMATTTTISVKQEIPDEKEEELLLNTEYRLQRIQETKVSLATKIQALELQMEQLKLKRDDLVVQYTKYDTCEYIPAEYQSGGGVDQGELDEEEDVTKYTDL